MAVYTVHEPLPRKDEASADPERFAFVRDGFYFWAFLLQPLWMLWRRLWLVALIYFALSTGLQFGLWAIGAADFVKFAVWLLLSLLIGFEAGTLRRWTLTRRGWRNLGVVVGDDVESAERRFFAAWTPERTPGAAPAPASPSPGGFPRSGENQIVGLFPQPGAPR
jgi:hypothetical protein